MTVDEALIEISQMREHKHIEPIGATPYELVQWTGLPLAKVIAELRSMRDDGILLLKPDKQGRIFYCYVQPDYYQEADDAEPLATKESARQNLQILQDRQKGLLAQLQKTTDTAEYQRLAREYSELTYKIETEQVLKDTAAANKLGKLDRAKRTVAIPHNYEKRGLNK